MTGHKKYIQFSGNMVQSPLFLTNEDNKRQLCQFLLCGEVEAASLLEKCGTAER